MCLINSETGDCEHLDYVQSIENKVTAPGLSIPPNNIIKIFMDTVYLWQRISYGTYGGVIIIVPTAFRDIDLAGRITHVDGGGNSCTRSAAKQCWVTII
jgi:hypothetical protein